MKPSALKPVPSCKDVLNAVMEDIAMCRRANPGRPLVTVTTVRMFGAIQAGLWAVTGQPKSGYMRLMESMVAPVLDGDEMRAITRVRP